MQYINSIISQYKFLFEDFIGIRFYPVNFLYFIYLLIFSLILFLTFYVIGRKLCQLFFVFTSQWEEKYFINIALGYIAFSSGIALLGMFSALHPVILVIYFALVLLLTLFPLNTLKTCILEIKTISKITGRIFAANLFLVAALLLFIGIVFLRLIPPEIGADALEYHSTFPKYYLFYNTMMLEPRGTESYITVPQLGEMLYLTARFFNALDASRIIHFLFYILSLLLVLTSGFYRKQNQIALYALLIISSSPLILHIASSGYSDFQAIFCFLLTMVLLTKETKLKSKTIVLSAVMIGAMLAAKLWSLILLPGFVIYIILRNFKSKASVSTLIFHSSLFLFLALIIPLPWYIRSFVLSGSPFYHSISYSPDIQKENLINLLLNSLDWLNKIKISMLADYSPLFFLGLIGIFISFQYFYKKQKTSPVFFFILIFGLYYIFLPSNLFDNRYFLSMYYLLALFSGAGLYFGYLKFKYLKFLYGGLIFALFIYYFINTAAILPYGIGWANKENYLTRKMTENMGAFYDFNHLFSKHLRKNEIIASYGIGGFYYAAFMPMHVNKIFDGKNNSINQLKEQKLNKLLIRGGDIEWFCKSLKVTDCPAYKITLLAKYSQAKQYLYKIE